MSAILIDPRVNLRPFDEIYRNEVIAEQEPWSVIPDGRYEVRVDKVELTTAKTSGNPMLKWTLRINGTTFRNRILWKNRVITENTLKYVKQDLSICGIELLQFSELPNRLPSLQGLEMEVAKQTRGDDVNILLLRRLGHENQADGGMTVDDIPF